MIRKFIILTILFIAFMPPLSAQRNSASVAFVNSSGQLIVASADGVTRWVVTSPGEFLHPALGFSWSPDGTQLFFAVDSGGIVSLRIGDPARMSVAEIGQVSGQLSGGEWANRNQILIAQNDSLILYPGMNLLISGAPALRIASPFTNPQPHLQKASSLSADRQNIFLQQGNMPMLFSIGGGLTGLPLNSDLSIQNNGLWSDTFPFIAYSGFEQNGNSALAVTSATNNNTIIFDSGRRTPVIPITWIPGTPQLIYRDATGLIRAVDVGCLTANCATNPFGFSAEILPPSASEIQFANGWAYFRDNNAIMALDLRCLGAGSCANSAIFLGGNAVPRAIMPVANNRLVYTAYAENAGNPTDREIRIIDLFCLPNCRPQTVLFGAISGLLSSDGQFVVADIIGAGLHVLSLSDLNMVYLSEPLSGSPGSGLQTIRWN